MSKYLVYCPIFYDNFFNFLSLSCDVIQFLQQVNKTSQLNKTAHAAGDWYISGIT